MIEYTQEQAEKMAALIEMLSIQNGEYLKGLFYAKRKNRILDIVVCTEDDKRWLVSAIQERAGISTAVAVCRMLVPSLSLKEAYDMVQSTRVQSLEKGEW